MAAPSLAATMIPATTGAGPSTTQAQGQAQAQAQAQAARLWRHLKDIPAASVLAFCGGFVDAAGFLGLYGLFTSSITGNLVVAAAAATGPGGVIPRVVITAVFVGTAGVSNLIALCLKRHHTASARTIGTLLMVLEVAFLGALWLAGALLDDTLRSIGNVEGWPVLLLGSFAAIAMGLQNGAVREAFVGYPPTTVMTSTLVNTGASLMTTLVLAGAVGGLWTVPPAKPITAPAPGAQASTDDASHTEQSMESLKRTELRKELSSSLDKLGTVVSPLVTFIAGAALGALTFFYGRWHCMAIPVALLLFLLMELTLQRWVDRKRARHDGRHEHHQQQQRLLQGSGPR